MVPCLGEQPDGALRSRLFIPFCFFRLFAGKLARVAAFAAITQDQRGLDLLEVDAGSAQRAFDHEWSVGLDELERVFGGISADQPPAAVRPRIVIHRAGGAIDGAHNGGAEFLRFADDAEIPRVGFFQDCDQAGFAAVPGFDGS